MLDYKVRRLADLMRLSKKTILYIDATTTTNEGFDSKKAITYCEVKQVKPIFTHPGFSFSGHCSSNWPAKTCSICPPQRKCEPSLLFMLKPLLFEGPR